MFWDDHPHDLHQIWRKFGRHKKVALQIESRPEPLVGIIVAIEGEFLLLRKVTNAKVRLASRAIVRVHRRKIIFIAPVDERGTGKRSS